MAHAAFATVWRDANFAKPLSAPVAKSRRFAEKLCLEPWQPVAPAYGDPDLVGRAVLCLPLAFANSARTE